MGRPSLGNQARTIQQGTKVSRDEIAWLESLHGSAHKGLRAALDFYKREQLRHEDADGNKDYVAALEQAEPPAWTPPVEVLPAEPTGPRPVVPVDEDGTPIPCRIHLKWEYVAEYYDKGIAMREKRCVACGHLVVERAK